MDQTVPWTIEGLSRGRSQTGAISIRRLALTEVTQKHTLTAVQAQA